VSVAREDIETWVGGVEAATVSRLLGDRRFPDAPQLVQRFRDGVDRWRDGGEVLHLIHDANELAAALAMLGSAGADDILRYEPPLTATKKTIDFLLVSPGGGRRWFDVKTIGPIWQDDEAGWQRFLAIAKDFPENARLIVAEDMGGAAISGIEFKARFSLVQRTAELEAKAALLTAPERGPVRLLVCSSGSWRRDALEDFADYYRTGRFRSDDWSRNLISRYMADAGVALGRTLDGFCYLERRHDDIEARLWAPEVRGPAAFAP
jgi:hypothetical protein